jgi:hypothetical protein
MIERVIELGNKPLFVRIDDLPDDIALRFIGIQVGGRTIVFRNGELVNEHAIAVEGEAVAIDNDGRVYLWLERGLYHTDEKITEIIAVSPRAIGD